MGKVFGPDKIGALTHNSGTITLGRSTLTIGGQQYRTSAILAVSVPAIMTAVTCYYIYAVLFSGSLTLTISTNANSVGPSGYTAWKLVGAFYSNGLSGVTFGSFINLEGPPSTEWFGYDPSLYGMTLGNGRMAFRCRVVADTLEVQGVVYWGSTSSSSAAIGIILPGTMEGNTSKIVSRDANGSNANYNVGKCSFYDASANRQYDGHDVYYNTTQRALFGYGHNGSTTAAWVASFPVTIASNDALLYDGIVVPIMGWTNTPLKDL